MTESRLTRPAASPWIEKLRGWLRPALTPAANTDRWIEGRFRPSRSLGQMLQGPGVLAYRLFLPTGAASQGRMPLLVMLHGCRQDSLTFAAGTRMNALAERHGFAVLYPEQSSQANTWRCWNWFHYRTLQGGGESGLIAGLVAEIRANYPIDGTRIYVVGMSAGAAMARILAMRHGTLFAACGVHSGLMYRAATTSLQALGAMRRGSVASPEATGRELVSALGGFAALVPTLAVHGSADDVVNPINLDQIEAQFVALDAALNGTVEPLVAEEVPAEPSNGRNCHIREYRRNGQVLLRRCLIDGLGHAWSGGDPAHPFNDAAGPDASEWMWSFLSRLSLQPHDAPRGGRRRWWQLWTLNRGAVR